MADALPFDSVRVGARRMPVQEFLALPVHVRVQHMLGGDLEFFHGAAVVDRRKALDALRGSRPAAR